MDVWWGNGEGECCLFSPFLNIPHVQQALEPSDICIFETDSGKQGLESQVLVRNSRAQS